MANDRVWTHYLGRPSFLIVCARQVGLQETSFSGDESGVCWRSCSVMIADAHFEYFVETNSCALITWCCKLDRSHSLNRYHTEFLFVVHVSGFCVSRTNFAIRLRLLTFDFGGSRYAVMKIAPLKDEPSILQRVLKLSYIFFTEGI